MDGGNETYRKESKQFIWTCSTACKKKLYVNDKVIRSDPKKIQNEDIVQMLRGVLLQGARKINEEKEIKKKIHKLSQEVEVIKDKCEKYCSELNELKDEVRTLKQDKINNKAICFEVPYEFGKNDNLFQQFLQDNEIETNAKMIKKFKSKVDPKNCNVIVQFKDSTKKLQFIKQMKNRKNKENSEKMYAVESLTMDNKQLLREAKSCLKDYEYVWSKNGRIFAKMDKDKQPIWIKNSSFLKGLIKKENSPSREVKPIEDLNDGGPSSSTVII